ncbi:hypothetical protein QWJ34_18300 [Saccharibacillus sp. CPCC 101409]|uniref:hypothetical protein n=1 Tax=Saccharibacillus sp. CPCC 101409 TaxID=3058041 RepID=UPI002672EC30|nr:hypothetical protein [Saccharibacillus sp. CPCC 101409]MDO3411720.1 hypothetical protein [Saccharibacillus sp. CPCC 101409]
MSSKAKIAGCALLVILFEAAGVRSLLYPDYVQGVLYAGTGIVLASSIVRGRV